MRLLCLVTCLAVNFVFIFPCLADSTAPSHGPADAVSQKTAAAAMPADMQKALDQLDVFAQKRMKLLRDNIRPSVDKKAVIQAGVGYTARYLDVDVSSLTTEITPARGAGAQYIGSVIYYEQIFESSGATKEEALTGVFELVKLRHITELFRYNRGKWID